MKKFFSTLLILATMVGGLSSCSDDDDDEDLASAIAGTYTGTAKLSVLGTTIDSIAGSLTSSASSDYEVEFEDATVTITRDDDDEVDITFSNLSLSYSFASISVTALKLGSFTLDDVSVSKLVSTYRFGYKKFEETVSYTMGTSTGTTTISGFIYPYTNTVEDGTLDITLHNVMINDYLPVGVTLDFVGD